MEPALRCDRWSSSPALTRHEARSVWRALPNCGFRFLSPCVGTKVMPDQSLNRIVLTAQFPSQRRRSQVIGPSAQHGLYDRLEVITGPSPSGPTHCVCVHQTQGLALLGPP